MIQGGCELAALILHRTRDRDERVADRPTIAMQFQKVRDRIQKTRITRDLHIGDLAEHAIRQQGKSGIGRPMSPSSVCSRRMVSRSVELASSPIALSNHERRLWA